MSPKVCFLVSDENLMKVGLCDQSVNVKIKESQIEREYFLAIDYAKRYILDLKKNNEKICVMKLTFIPKIYSKKQSQNVVRLKIYKSLEIHPTKSDV
jgi:hypothetical protein